MDVHEVSSNVLFWGRTCFGTGRGSAKLMLACLVLAWDFQVISESESKCMGSQALGAPIRQAFLD